MENSVSPDYVTEKLWDGLVAGCVPVYMGAPSAVTMVPDRQGIIVYDPTGRGNASTPQELAQLLDAIGRDKNLYESMLRWKYNKVCWSWLQRNITLDQSRACNTGGCC